MNDALSFLLHDVGKYVSRIARNVAEGAPVPAALAPLLVKDVYETHRGRPASVRFAELSPDIDGALVATLSPMFTELDALEAAARRHDPDALLRAAELARSIESVIRAAATRRA